MNEDSKTSPDLHWSAGAATAVYVATAVKSCAVTTFWWVIPVHVHRLTGGEQHVLTNIMIFALPQVGGFVLAHLVGGLIDLTGRIKAFVVLAIAVQTATCVVLLFVGTPLLILLSVGAAVAFNITLNTTLKTYVTRAQEDAHGKALGSLFIASSTGWFVGGAVVTFFFVSPDPAAIRSLLIADLVLMLLSLATVVALLPRAASLGRAPSTERVALIPGIAAELRLLYGNRILTTACFAGVVIGVGNWVYAANYGVYVTEHLRAPERTIGLIAAASALTSAIGGWLTGRFYDRYGATATLRLGAVLYAAMYLVFAIWPSVTGAYIVFMTPAYIAVLVALTGLAARVGGTAHRGGGVGIVDALWAGSIGVGAVVGAAVARVGLGYLPITALGFIAVGTLLTWLLVRADTGLPASLRAREAVDGPSGGG